MRLTDRKRDELIDTIETSRRDLLDVAASMRTVVNKLLVLDSTMARIQELAKGTEALMEQEPDESH